MDIISVALKRHSTKAFDASKKLTPEQAEQIKTLRAQLPHTFFLVPGYGAQGGTAEDVQYAFDANGRGAIVNSSRGIMCAWKKTGHNGEDYQQAARDAAIAMREDICRFITIQ